jgi:hypothetical protein
MGRSEGGASGSRRRASDRVSVAVLAVLLAGVTGLVLLAPWSPASPGSRPASGASAGATGAGAGAGAGRVAAGGTASPATPAGAQLPGPVTAALVPWSQLDRHWGPYLSEREWGNPREAVAGNGWGLGYSLAMRTPYAWGEDGIAGLEDDAGRFHVAWAFWDRVQRHITERLYGLDNSQGLHGETIAENRVFHEATPTSSYLRYEYHYPTVQPLDQVPPLDRVDTGQGTFTIQLEAARVDDGGFALRATATNTSASPARLTLALKGWLGAPGSVTAVPGGIALAGSSSTVALVAVTPPAGIEITGDKAALDRDVRAGTLAAGTGNIGALVETAALSPGATVTWLFGMTEAGSSPGAAGKGGAAGAAAEGTAAAPGASAGTGGAAASADARARAIAAEASPIADARRVEASDVFAGQVTAHEPLYRQLLMDLLWNQSYYAWDGSRASWSGTVAAHDVLIMPDKWEFPWPASWDDAFQAVAASLIDRTLAEDQLRFFLSPRWQQPDGHVPCAEWVMTDECPPILGWAAWTVSGTGADTAFLREVYPRLALEYRYWQSQLQDPRRPGLYSAGFLGMDNLPRSGGPEADASGWMALFARSMAQIARVTGDRPAAAAYERDLATIDAAVNRHLWNDRAGIYEDLSPSGGFVDAPSYAGLVPLIAGIVPADRRARLLAELGDPARFLAPGGIRSLSKASPLYQPGYANAAGVNSNWLGPVWVPLDYLLIEALRPIDPRLAETVRDRVVTMVEQDWERTGHVHEYYDADTGQGIGADAQTGWTALVANLIREAWPAGG